MYQYDNMKVVVVVFVLTSHQQFTSKFILRWGHSLKSHPTKMLMSGIEPANPGLQQGEQLIHYSTVAPSI